VSVISDVEPQPNLRDGRRKVEEYADRPLVALSNVFLSNFNFDVAGVSPWGNKTRSDSTDPSNDPDPNSIHSPVYVRLNLLAEPTSEDVGKQGEYT
jgi:hypothetical protein